MKIYIDNDYKCQCAPAKGLREFDVSFFDDKCAAFIEGYRYIPPGESWPRSDGKVFSGEIITPWRDPRLLDEFQAQYEAQLAAADAAYQEGVNTAYD